MDKKIAFLVDGGYFIRRIEFFNRHYFKAHPLALRMGELATLDPLFGNVAKGLERHIDGKKSYDLVSKISQLLKIQPEPLPGWWKNE